MVLVVLPPILRQEREASPIWCQHVNIVDIGAVAVDSIAEQTNECHEPRLVQNNIYCYLFVFGCCGHILKGMGHDQCQIILDVSSNRRIE